MKILFLHTFAVIFFLNLCEPDKQNVAHYAWDFWGWIFFMLIWICILSFVMSLWALCNFCCCYNSLLRKQVSVGTRGQTSTFKLAQVKCTTASSHHCHTCWDQRSSSLPLENWLKKKERKLVILALALGASKGCAPFWNAIGRCWQYLRWISGAREMNWIMHALKDSKPASGGDRSQYPGL